MERQSEKAKIFLKKRDELKKQDVNLFLLEMDQIDLQMKEVVTNYEITDTQLKEAAASHDKIKGEYEKMEALLESVTAEIEAEREELNQSAILKGKLEGQINVLNEQIKAAEMSDEHFKSRTAEIEADKQEKVRQKTDYETEKQHLDEQLKLVGLRREKAESELHNLQKAIADCNAGMESGKNELLQLLNQRAQIQTEI